MRKSRSSSDVVVCSLPMSFLCETKLVSNVLPTPSGESIQTQIIMRSGSTFTFDDKMWADVHIVRNITAKNRGNMVLKKDKSVHKIEFFSLVTVT